jgi:tetratricopeptide (TPR) repeat protein
VKIHPSDLLLEETLLCLGGAQRSILQHLATCTECQSRLGCRISQRPHPGASTISLDALGLTWPKSSRLAGSVDYSNAIERSERKYLKHAEALRQERAEAPVLLAELLNHRPEQRKLVSANSPRFQTWGLYELLLERSWEIRGESRARSEELAQLAIHLAPHLDQGYYPLALVEDLLARGWSYIANLRRLASDFSGAEEAFERAYAHLKRGTHEPLERALFLDLKASFRGAQRRLDEAIRMLRRAVTIFLHQGDGHLAGKSLVNLAAIYGYAQEHEAAISVLRNALQLIDPSQDERLLLCAWHNLTEYLTNLGRFIEAQGLYRKARPLYRKYDDEYWHNRRLWVKGKIARGLGQSQEAEALFLEARERYLSEEIPFDAALVSLELAVLYAEQDRTAELKQLATEMLAIFSSRHTQCEALAALTFLKQAADAERLTIQTAAGISTFLRRAEADPSLKFEGPI